MGIVPLFAIFGAGVATTLLFIELPAIRFCSRLIFITFVTDFETEIK